MLLPPNGKALEKALERLTGERIEDLRVPLRDLWSAQNCPEDLLPWLAWALSIDQWDAAWPLHIRRARVASAIAIQRIKGTAKSVSDVVASFGGHVRLREWFQQDPPGEPHTFALSVTLGGQGDVVPSADFIDAVIAEVARTKPARAHFDFVVGLNLSGQIGIKAVGRPLIAARLQGFVEAGSIADTTPPTITSANPSGGYPELQAIGGALTANEAVAWSKTGADAARVTLNPATGVWSLEVTDFETKSTYSWVFRATDLAGNVTTQPVAITISDVDEVPDSFAFVDMADVLRATLYVSNLITVSGIPAGVSVPVSVAGASYSKNGGAYTTAPGTAQLGDTFRVRHTSSTDYATAISTTLTIGGISDTFTTTTEVAPVGGGSTGIASVLIAMGLI
jgi:phage tail P2-like protein